MRLPKAGIVDVTVTGSATSNTLKFTVSNPAPTVVSISQQTILLTSPSFPLEIAGTNFVAGTTVDVGGQSLVPTSVSPTRLTVAVPATSLIAAAVPPIKVLNPAPGGGTPSELSSTVLNPVPVLTSLSLNSTLVDSADFVLSLDGTGFAAGATVTFGSTHLTPTAVSANQLTVLVPKAAVATGATLAATASSISPEGGTSNSLAFTVMNPVTVINPGPGGGVSSTLTFTVINPVSTIAALSQDKVVLGSGAFPLTITGTGFVPQSTVEFGTSNLIPSAVSPAVLTVTIAEAAMAKADNLTITNPAPGGGISNATRFIVQNPAQVVTAASPTSITASVSDVTLTITGTSFVEGATTILFQLYETSVT